MKNSKVILSLMFLVTIFFISMAALPKAALNVIDTVRNNKSDKTTYQIAIDVHYKVDEDYRNMLEFKGNVISNKGTYINLNGLMANIMGQRLHNTRIKLNNGNLTYLTSISDVSEAAIQMTELFESQKEKGRSFLFVLAPFQISPYEDLLPVGYEDYANMNSDNMIKALSENNVPYLDLRQELHNDGIRNKEAFFISDHHWNPQTGFWAYGKIVKYLSDNRIIPRIDEKYTNIENYNVDIQQDIYLGSAGKRTGQYFAGIDDFAFITPKFTTDMSVDIVPRKIKKSGDFKEVAFETTEFEKDYFNTYIYDSSYGNRNGSGKVYNNFDAPTDKKILVINDSMGLASCTFLSLIAKEYRALDMRDFDEALKVPFTDYYDDYNPDILIVLVNAGAVVQENTEYDYFK